MIPFSVPFIIILQCMSLENLALLPAFTDLTHLHFASRTVDDNIAVWETPDHQTPIISDRTLLQPLKKCHRLQSLGINNKISSEVLDALFEEEDGCLR